MCNNGNSDGRALEGASFKELRLLEEVDAASATSQRTLAGNVGIALGVVNVLIKSMVTKGYIRATRMGWKRWAYVLTPAGVTRKLQLSANYVDRFLDHYRRVLALVRETLDGAHVNPDSTVAIYGTTELGELMFLVLKEYGVKRVVFLDESGPGEFLGIPVKPLDTIDPYEYAGIMVAFPTGIDSRKQTLVRAGIRPDNITTLLDPPACDATIDGSEAMNS
jgi:predicted transcriptional regulator